MPSNHLILCQPFLLLLSIFPSIRIFSNELALHSFSDGYSGLISFGVDWFDLIQERPNSRHQIFSDCESVLDSDPLALCSKIRFLDGPGWGLLQTLVESPVLSILKPSWLTFPWYRPQHLQQYSLWKSLFQLWHFCNRHSINVHWTEFYCLPMATR